MSDTPETEAVAVIEGNWDTKALRMGDLARKLERERNQWKAAHDNQVKLKQIISDRPDLKERAKLVAELVEERDECKKLAVEQHLHIEELDKENENQFELIEKLTEEDNSSALNAWADARKLERERDVAYAALRSIREGYGGQKVDEECRCDDCDFLRPIDAILKKVKIHKFWIPSENSTGTSKYKNFVSKADYDSLLKQFNELKNSEYDRGKEDGYSLAHDEIRYIR